MPAATQSATDVALASALRMSVMRLARRLRSQRADSTLSISQLAALATLERLGPVSPGELAAHEKVQPPSMTRIVAGLEESGLVTRVPHPSDRRQVLLSASAAGKSLLRDDRRRRDAWLSQRLRSLPPEDLSTLREAAAVFDRLASS